jgi:hypothetical protein
MASKKLSSDTSLANSYKLSRGLASVARPSAPTIGTATDTGSGLMSVTFTASTLGPTASSFTLTSSSGVTGSGASSPLTLQEAAVGTYTYSVSGVNANGTGPSSAASNSVVVSSVYSSSYESIATATVGAGGASSVTFSSIPSTYTHLQVRLFGRSTGSNVQSFVKLEFNSDTTGSNYYSHYIQGDGSSIIAGPNAGISAHYDIAGANATSSVFGAIIFDVLDYANTNKNKTSRVLGGVDNNGSGRMNLASGLWLNTSAINSLTITSGTGSFVQYTSAALYGIKAA